MKKLLQLFCSFFKRKRKKKEHTCEELDYPFFSFLLVIVVTLLLTVQAQAADAAEIYFFSQHSDMKNSKANEYVDFQARENIFGLGFITHIVNKDKDKLDLRAGLGKSDTDIKISQTVNVLNKVYSVNQELNYNTSMYLFNISYSYKISKSFSIQAEFEQSKNALKRDTYMIKLSYQF